MLFTKGSLVKNLYAFCFVKNVGLFLFQLVSNRCRWRMMHELCHSVKSADLTELYTKQVAMLRHKEAIKQSSSLRKKILLEAT